MLKSFVLLLGISAAFSQIQRPNEDEIFKAFNNFILKHNKTYNSIDEFNSRYSIFKNNYLMLVHRLTARPTTSSQLGVTKFFDHTLEEFRQRFANLKLGHFPKHHHQLIRHIEGEAPDDLDWREKGVVGPVRDQGACGACWAFTVVENIQSLYAIKNGKFIEFSVQQLLDCNGEGGCSPAPKENPYEYIRKAGGLMLAKDYKTKGGTCQFDKTKVAVKISSYIKLDSKDEVKMANLLATTGPLSVVLNADTLQFYVGGIVDDDESTCDPKGLNHNVLLVGYGSQNGQKFWIFKNSWGSSWGEGGYARIARGKGTCGINSDVNTAVLD